MTTRTRHLVLGYFLSNKVTGEPYLFGSTDPQVVRLFSTAEKAELFNTKWGNNCIVKPCFELITEVVEEEFSKPTKASESMYYYKVIANLSANPSLSDFVPYFTNNLDKAQNYLLSKAKPSDFILVKVTSSEGSEPEELIPFTYYEIIHTSSGRPGPYSHPLDKYTFYKEAESKRLSYAAPKEFHIEATTVPKKFMVVETATGMPCVDNYRITLEFPSRESAETYRKSLDSPTYYEVRSMYV